MAYVDFNDTTIPAYKRKAAFLRWALSKGTPEQYAINIANKKFGRTGRNYVVRLAHADNMDNIQNRWFTWTIAALTAGTPHPKDCDSVVIVCDETYASFDLCDGFDVLPGSWAKDRHDLPSWETCEAWAKARGFELTEILDIPETIDLKTIKTPYTL